MSYKGFGNVVDSCPLSKQATVEAASKLSCAEDKFGRSRYVCVPNEDLTAVLEFCYNKTIVGLYQSGHCLKTIQNGFLDQIGCKNFTEGCPKDNYRSTDLYKYPACHRLNAKDRCFVADPSCNTFTMTETSRPDTSVSVGIIGIFGPLLMLLGILFITFFWRRRQKQKQERGNEDEKYSEQSELLQGKEMILYQKTSDETRNKDGNFLGQSELLHGTESILSEQPSNKTKLLQDEETLLSEQPSDEKNVEKEEMKVRGNEDGKYLEQSELLQDTERILSEKPSDNIRNEDGHYLEQSEQLQDTETILYEKPSDETKDERGKDSDPFDEGEQDHPIKLQMKDTEICTIDQKDIAFFRDEIHVLVHEIKKELSKSSKSPKHLEENAIIIFRLLSNAEEDECKEAREEIRKRKDKDPIQEFENIFENLQNRIENLILKRDKNSACLAAECIDFYSYLAILRPHLYAIKKRDSCDQKHAMEETNTADPKIIESITKSSFERVVFLTMFNPTELQYFPHFISGKGIKLFRLDTEDGFCSKRHLIRSVKWTQWHLKMGWDVEGYIWSRKNVDSTPCQFLFEPVKDREIDNIFYITSMRYPDYYVVMKEGLLNLCASVKRLPGLEGQWKIIRFIKDENPCYVMSPLSKPCFFIYMTRSPFGIARGTDDLQEIEKKGIWHVIDADSKS